VSDDVDHVLDATDSSPEAFGNSVKVMARYHPHENSFMVTFHLILPQAVTITWFLTRHALHELTSKNTNFIEEGAVAIDVDTADALWALLTLHIPNSEDGYMLWIATSQLRAFDSDVFASVPDGQEPISIGMFLAPGE
jgi:hypothetical protein